MPYKVLVDDNFHYLDESERYELGEYRRFEEAVAAAKRLVDDYLRWARTPGMTSGELYASYTGFGEDPFVVAVPPSPPGEPRFSAWDYARARCDELCGPPAPSPGHG